MRSWHGMGAALAAGFLLAGCASATRGTTSTIQVVTEPAGAQVSTSLGYQCVSPCTITAARKDEFSVTLSKAGFEPQTIEVKTRASDEGKAAMAGNIVAGGLIGAGVDAANGADLDHFPNPIHVTLVPVKRGTR